MVTKLTWVTLLALILVLLSYNHLSNRESSSESLKDYDLSDSVIVISRMEYKDKLYGFWLGQCIANWTGLVTEMDKIGNIGDIKTGEFYTMKDWGRPDLPNIWSKTPSDISDLIDFVFVDDGDVWGADDDTDIEYIYQNLHYNNRTSILTGEQIKDGWLKHIRKKEEKILNQ